MKIHMIVAALPPELDGIGDYTVKLSKELAQYAGVTILTTCPNPDPIPGIDIQTVFSVDDPGSVAVIEDRVVSEKPDWVVLQYCPFSYGRWGLNLQLPEVFHRIKRRLPTTNFAVMVHEPFVPIESCKLAVMTTWQRWQLRRLGSASNLILFSIQPWADRFRGWFPGKHIMHLPVGSNIDQSVISKEEARRRLNIPPQACVLGIFGWMHDSRMMSRVEKAAKTVGKNAIVLYIGPNPDAASASLSSIDYIAEGPFPPEEISRRFAAMDISLSAFNDGISTRRGSFMCALAHGIPTVGTRGCNTDQILLKNDGSSFLLAETMDEGEFCAHVARLDKDKSLWKHLSKNSKQLYLDHFSWPVLGRKLLSRMEEVSGGAPCYASPKLQRDIQTVDSAG